MKHAVITGASGFIGGWIVREFLEQGWGVTATIHRHESEFLHEMADGGRVQEIRTEVREKCRLRSDLVSAAAGYGGRIDAIVHCAGRATDVGWEREFRETNFESVRHLTGIVTDLEIPRLVFVSTIDVYGLNDYCGQSEQDLETAENPCSSYPRYKILAEKWITEHLAPERYSIIRPGQVWGPGDTTLTARAVDFLRKSPWIIHFGRWRGTNRWPLAHVRNVAAVSYLATISRSADGQAINVIDKEFTTIDQFYRMIARIYLGREKLRTLFLPYWVGMLVAAPVTLISNALNLKHPFMDPSVYALKSVSSNLDLSNDRMMRLFRECGRQPVTLEQGISELEARS